MKYLKDDPFIAVTGEPFRLTETDDDTGKIIRDEEATVGQVVATALRAYDTNHAYFVRQGAVLPPAEASVYNDVLEILASPPQVRGHYRFEDPHWSLIRKVIGWVGPAVSWWRNSPLIEQLLDAASSDEPE